MRDFSAVLADDRPEFLKVRAKHKGQWLVI